MSTQDQIEREANEIALDVHARAKRLHVHPHHLIDLAKQHVTLPTRPLLDANSDNPLEASIARDRAQRFDVHDEIKHEHASIESGGDFVVEITPSGYVVRESQTGSDYEISFDDARKWSKIDEWQPPAQCTCVMYDDGDGESGPHLVVEHVPDCPQHGVDAMPDAWADDAAIDFGYALTSGRLEALLDKAGWGVRDNETRCYLSDGYDTREAAIDAAREPFARLDR